MSREIETRIIIKVKEKLPSGYMVAECEMVGEDQYLGAMLQGAMDNNVRLAGLVVGAALFFMEEHNMDALEWITLYKNKFKHMK